MDDSLSSALTGQEIEQSIYELTEPKNTGAFLKMLHQSCLYVAYLVILIFPVIRQFYSDLIKFA